VPTSTRAPRAETPAVTFAPQITIVVEGEIDEARIKSVSIKAHDSEEGQELTLKNIRVLKKRKEIS
jgi:hypothetical protein